MQFSQEQINKWYLHKSNKELWIEEQEREDYFRRKAMVNSNVELSKIEDYNEGMAWDMAHDHKEACTCLPERYNPYE